MSSSTHRFSVTPETSVNDSITTPTVEFQDLCENFRTHLDLDLRTLSISWEIVGKVNTAQLLGSWPALIVAACSLYIASHIMGQPRTTQEISEVTCVGDATIRSAYILVYPEIQSITEPSWYMDDDTPWYEPPSLDREMSIFDESPNGENHIPRNGTPSDDGATGSPARPVAGDHILNSSGSRYELELGDFGFPFSSADADFSIFSQDEETNDRPASVDDTGISRASSPPSSIVDKEDAIPNLSNVEASLEYNLDRHIEPEPWMPSSARYLRNLEALPVADLPADCRACNLCFEPYLTASTNEVAVKLSPCGHIFGYDCLERWICSERKTTCPMCRTSLYQDDTRQEANAQELSVPWVSTLIEAVNRRAEAPEVSSIKQHEVSSLFRQFSIVLAMLTTFSYSAEVLEIFNLFRRFAAAEAEQIAPALAT